MFVLERRYDHVDQGGGGARMRQHWGDRTEDGIGFFKSHLANLGKYVAVEPPKKTEKKERPHLSDFPGIDAIAYCASPCRLNAEGGTVVLCF